MRRPCRRRDTELGPAGDPTSRGMGYATSLRVHGTAWKGHRRDRGTRLRGARPPSAPGATSRALRRGQALVVSPARRRPIEELSSGRDRGAGTGGGGRDHRLRPHADVRVGPTAAATAAADGGKEPRGGGSTPVDLTRTTAPAQPLRWPRTWTRPARSAARRARRWQGRGGRPQVRPATATAGAALVANNDGLLPTRPGPHLVRVG